MKLSTRPFKSFGGWFNPTLFKKNVTRFWPIWVIYMAGLFFMLPMSLISESHWYGPEELFTGAEDVLRTATQAAPAVGLFFGVVAAMALFSYLMTPRSCQMLHALPIRREGIFLTNWLSALWFCLVPNLVIFLVTLLTGLALGVNLALHLLVWLAVETACCMFFFSFGVFCAMFTGNLLALPVFYGILNMLVMGVLFLVDAILPFLLVGFPGSSLSGSAFARWCTPVIHLTVQVCRSGWEEDQLFHLDYSAAGITTTLCYCLVLGAAFTLAAVWVYRLRQLERSGDLVTVGWVRPVFQFGLGVCLGLTLGLWIYDRFFDDVGPWVLIALIILMAALGAFAGRMLLKKTLRVFAEGWKSVAVFALVLALLLGGARADLFGYQRWTPRPEETVRVRLSDIHSAPWDGGSYGSLLLTDQALTAQAVELHQGITGGLSQMEDWNGDGMGFVYTLSGGREVRRYYSDTPIREEELADPDSYTARLQALINQPECVKQLYFGSFLPEGGDLSRIEAAEGWLEGIAMPEKEKIELQAADGAGEKPQETVAADAEPVPAETEYKHTEYTNSHLTGEEARKLWDAVQEDLEAGRIGRRYLFEDEERRTNCYRTDLTLTLVYSRISEEGKRVTGTHDLRITIQRSADATLKVLEELGYRDRLMNWDQR